MGTPCTTRRKHAHADTATLRSARTHAMGPEGGQGASLVGTPETGTSLGPPHILHQPLPLRDTRGLPRETRRPQLSAGQSRAGRSRNGPGHPLASPSPPGPGGTGTCPPVLDPSRVGANGAFLPRWPRLPRLRSPSAELHLSPVR